MYVLIAGGGKAGANVMRTLLRHGHEATIMALIEHEVPEHELVHLLELRKENLEIVEVQIDKDSPCAGKEVARIQLPEGSRLISVMRGGKAEIAVGSTELRPGDQVLAILQPGKEDELRQVLLKK